MSAEAETGSFEDQVAEWITTHPLKVLSLLEKSGWMREMCDCGCTKAGHIEDGCIICGTACPYYPLWILIRDPKDG